MDIESKIKREGGTHVKLGATNYHFAPLADGAHVATVEDEDHIDRFLSITEGYRLYRGENVALAPSLPLQTMNYTDGMSATGTAPLPPISPDQQESGIEALYGSSVHPSRFEIHGTTYSLGDIVALAHTASGLGAAEWNGLAAESRAGMIDDELDKLNEAGPVPSNPAALPPADDAALRNELVAQFKAKFGKAPHHNAGIETIRAKLAEA